MLTLTIDEDDLMTEKNQDTLRLKSGNLLDESSGRKTLCLFRQQIKRIWEEFRERVYEAVRHIHVTVSLTISFSIQIIKMLWRKTKEETTNNS
jgi:hypothetical protein